MSETSKPGTQLDFAQTLQNAYNAEDKSFTTGSFVTAKVGHKIVKSVISPTVDDFLYYDGVTLLYTIRLTYVDAAHSDLVSTERIN